MQQPLKRCALKKQKVPLVDFLLEILQGGAFAYSNCFFKISTINCAQVWMQAWQLVP